MKVKYVSIKNKLASVAMFISKELKVRDHEVDNVRLDILFGDTREDIAQVVQSLFDCVNDAFYELITAPDFANAKDLQERFVRAAMSFDSYCTAYKVNPVLVIIVEDGGATEIYHVDNNDAELGVKLVA